MLVPQAISLRRADIAVFSKANMILLLPCIRSFSGFLLLLGQRLFLIWPLPHTPAASATLLPLTSSNLPTKLALFISQTWHCSFCNRAFESFALGSPSHATLIYPSNMSLSVRSHLRSPWLYQIPLSWAVIKLETSSITCQCWIFSCLPIFIIAHIIDVYRL